MSAYDRPDPRLPREDAEVIELDSETPLAADATGDDTAQIREGIEQTRAEMSETIDAIQDRLSPQRMANEVKEQVREATIGRAQHMVDDVMYTARDTGNGILDTIRENPVPAALAAIGVGWLWFSRPKSDRSWREGDRAATRRVRYGGYAGDEGRYEGGYDYRSRAYRAGPRYERAANRDYYSGATGQSAAGQAVGRVQDTAGQAVGRAQDAAGQAVGTVRQAASQAGDAVQGAVSQATDTAQQVGGQVQYQTTRARYGLESTFYQNPLAMGAVALAAGLAVGLAAPSTDLEDQLLGDTRDRVVQGVQEQAQGAMQKAQQVAQRATETVKDEAKKQGLAGQ